MERVLSYDRRLICGEPRQDLGLCAFSDVTQIYRRRHFPVPAGKDTNMAAGKKAKYLSLSSISYRARARKQEPYQAKNCTEKHKFSESLFPDETKTQKVNFVILNYNLEHNDCACKTPALYVSS